MFAAFVEWLGALGAGLTLLILEAGVFFGPIFIGAAIAERRKSTWQGWLGGFISLALLAAIFMPSIGALQESACKGTPDFQSCMEGEDE